jgi:hypothetical protein
VPAALSGSSKEPVSFMVMGIDVVDEEGMLNKLYVLLEALE